LYQSPARPGDLAAVQELLRRAALPFEDLTAEHLRLFMLIRDASATVGVVGVERFGNDGLLRSLAIDVNHRSRAMARAIVKALEAHAASGGIRRLYLLTATAQDFFAKHGYTVVPRGSDPDQH
jgi:amino-acid N-acetyltransferase